MIKDQKPNPEIKKLLIAQLPADFADWLDFVAIGALLAFQWNSEPFVFAILAFSMGLPYLLVGPFAGVVVDRMDAKTIMIRSNIGRAIVTAAFFFAPNWPTLMILIFARSSVDTFFTPSKQAAIQTLSVPENRTRVNGLSHAINQASKIIAPTIGGGLLIWFNPHLIFLMNAGVSVLAALLLCRMKPLGRTFDKDEAEKETLFKAISQGLNEVRSKNTLRTAIVMMATGYFAMFFYDTLIAPLTRDLGFTQTHLGLSLAAVGAGGVLGAMGLGLMKEIHRPFLWIACGSLTGGSVVIGLGLSEIIGAGIQVIVFIMVFAILGIATAISVVPFRTIIQNTVSENSIGKVTALSEAVNTIALLTAPFIGAVIASIWSIGAAFVLGGVVMLLTAIWAFTVRHYS